jgi:hypothetical protein
MRRSELEERVLAWSNLVHTALPLPEPLPLSCPAAKFWHLGQQYAEWLPTDHTASIALFDGFTSADLNALIECRLLRAAYLADAPSFRAATMPVDELLVFLVPQDLAGYRSRVCQEIRQQPSAANHAAFKQLLARLVVPTGSLAKKGADGEDSVVIASVARRPLLDLDHVRWLALRRPLLMCVNRSPR